MVLCEQHGNAEGRELNQDQCEDVDPCKYARIVGCDHLKTKRARKFRCRSKRVRQLAKPKNVTQKYCGEKTKFGQVDTEIVRTFEEQTPVRIKWLAYPNVRKLMSSCEAYKEIVSKKWHGRYEDLIRQSMLTLYSRLANVQPPHKICQRKWTKAERKRHSDWLKSRAVPKKVFQPPTPKRKKVPLETLVTSMYLLSRPRYPQAKYHPQKGYHSAVKENAMTYEPSERILKLAAPKRSGDESENGEEKDPFQVNPKALKFEPCKFLSYL